MNTRSDPLPHNASTRRRNKPLRKSGLGGTLLGVFIGIALGLALAAGVAFYLMKAGNPYASTGPGRDPAREMAKDSSKANRGDGGSEKPRFDFYRILPGAEEPKVQLKSGERAQDRATADRSAAPDKTVAKADEHAAPVAADKAAKVPERFWLQAGSFSNEADAENLKATLALTGWEAIIQAATLPDKGLRYRVRLGPYDNTDELGRMKTELAKRGFDAAVIKF